MLLAREQTKIGVSWQGANPVACGQAFHRPLLRETSCAKLATDAKEGPEMTQRENKHPHLDDDDGPVEESARQLIPRILWIVVITMLISVAQSVLFGVAALQVVIMIANKGRPNEELGDFGSMVGAWVAKAARYQSAASDQKPWPWTPMGS